MTPNNVGSAQMTQDGVKLASSETSEGNEATEESEATKSKEQEGSTDASAPTVRTERGSDDCPASPQVLTQPYQHAYIPHLTPQAGIGYYLYGNPQVTPEPPSPATPGYDVNSFLQQQAALGFHPCNPFGTNSQYGVIPQPPLSPGSRGMSGLIPPASPLFPRATSINPATGASSFDQRNRYDSSVLQGTPSGQPPASPSVPYMGPHQGSNSSGLGGATYQGHSAAPAPSGGTYASVLGRGMSSNAESSKDSEENEGWGERSPSSYQQQPPPTSYTQASPLQGQSLPSPYPGMTRGPNNRSYSFDEMLPPSILDNQDQASAPFSPYSSNHASGNTLFAHQSWGYGASGDMYNPPQSPLQPRPNLHMTGFPSPHGGGMGMPMHHLGHYGGQQHMSPFYPTTSPGPPIQTTASNKGPDGANLFIFHIPNHFTNLDMYRLFCLYGNLLSVRIMVEKDTGRSRGFGFVSYDSPESAALAIKELNGFAIGNKRLKVQHKQIRGDQQRGGYSGSPQDGGEAGFLPRQDMHHHHYYHPDDEGMGLDPSWFDASAGEIGVSGRGESTEEVLESNDQGGGGERQGQEVGSTPGLPALGGDNQSAQRPVALSPLTSLEPLRSALPEAAGHAETVE